MVCICLADQFLGKAIVSARAQDKKWIRHFVDTVPATLYVRAMNTLNDPENDSSQKIILGLLSAVHENNAITQRAIAQKVGIALGLANGLLRRCINKGLIKVFQAPANRYTYYLTPKGFSEKSQLTARFLSQSLQLFRVSQAQSEKLLAFVRQQKWQRVALVGCGDLSEIILLCHRAGAPVLVGTYDPEASIDSQHGLPVVRDLSALSPLDAVIITDMTHPQQTYEQLKGQFDENRLLSFPLLAIARNRRREEDQP